MTMPQRTRQRLVIVGVFAIFMAPILAALYMNLPGNKWLPFGTRNQGELVRPPPQILASALRSVDGMPWTEDSFVERWTIAVRAELPCESPCISVVETTLRARLALGDDISRAQVALILDRAPAAQQVRDLLSHYAGVRVLVTREGEDTVFSSIVQQPGFAVIDPQGFLILKYAPAMTATALLKDLQRLLRLSSQH